MNLLLILQAAPAVTDLAAETVVKEMNLWEMFKYGGPIMYVLVFMFAFAMYLLIERLITLKTALKEDNSFMNRIKDYIYDGKIDAAVKPVSYTHLDVYKRQINDKTKCKYQ